MKKNIVILLFVMFALLAAISLTGCATETVTEDPKEPEVSWRMQEPYKTIYASFREDPPDPATLDLTDDEIDTIREGNFNVALCMHFLEDPWSEQIIRGIRSVLDELNVNIIATTDAGFDSAKQTDDLETVVALQPDAIFSLPTDELAMGPAYKVVADAGIPLILTCNIFKGAVHQENFETAIICNSWDNGRLAAEILAEQLGGEGKVATIEFGAEFYCTQEREIHFKKILNDKYPNIELVATRYFSNADEVTEITESLLHSNPEIEGLFVTWDLVAMNAVAGLRSIGREDVIVVTTDIGDEVSREIAMDGIVKGTASHSAVDQGIMAGKAIANVLLGKKLSLFYRAPSTSITRVNLEEAYPMLLKKDLPAEIANLLD